MGHSSNGTDNEQVMAFAFAPNGEYLAAVSAAGTVLIWNAYEGGPPKASWKHKGGKFRRGSTPRLKGINGSGTANGSEKGNMIGSKDEEVDYHNLAWSADGARIAYCVNREVCHLRIIFA